MPEDIENYAGIPTLAVLPSAKDMKKFSRQQNKHVKKGGGKLYG